MSHLLDASHIKLHDNIRGSLRGLYWRLILQNKTKTQTKARTSSFIRCVCGSSIPLRAFFKNFSTFFNTLSVVISFFDTTVKVMISGETHAGLGDGPDSREVSAT